MDTGGFSLQIKRIFSQLQMEKRKGSTCVREPDGRDSSLRVPAPSSGDESCLLSSGAEQTPTLPHGQPLHLNESLLCSQIDRVRGPLIRGGLGGCAGRAQSNYRNPRA